MRLADLPSELKPVWPSGKRQMLGLLKAFEDLTPISQCDSRRALLVDVAAVALTN